MGLSWWVNFISFMTEVCWPEVTYTVPEVVVVYIPEDPSHDLVVEPWNLFGFDNLEYKSSFNNNILAGQNWKIIAENTERLLIQMPISGPGKDGVKSASRKEVIWNEERDDFCGRIS